jgi:guanylate kinase
MTAPRGQLVVMSGPSGSGKTTIKNKLAQHPRIKLAISVTTRPQRNGEVDDKDYHFVTREEFLAMNEQGRFLETNDVFSNGHLYGSLRSEMEAALADADCVYLMEVDVTGAHNIKDATNDGTYVFIAPPSAEVLEQRLRRRATDSDEAIERRLARAAEERRQAEADGSTIVVNEDVDQAVRDVLTLIGLEANAGSPR